MARLKLFTGIEVGSTIRSSAAKLQTALAGTGAEVKWVEPENLHITINFLGDVDDRDLHGICKALEAVGRQVPPFRLEVAGVGAFPTMRRPKVLWTGVTNGQDELRTIHEMAEPKLLQLGVYRREERGYTPHLTLGRVKDESHAQTIATELANAANWRGGDLLIEEFALYASELRREGPVYSIVARFELSGR